MDGSVSAPRGLVVPERPQLADRARGRLSGKVALVTGAGDPADSVPSIGHAIAVLLAHAGAAVAVVDVDAAAAQRTVDRITDLGGRAIAALADLRSRESVEAAVEQTASSFGALDVVVNAAAVLGDASTLDAGDDEILATLDVNLMGTIRVSRAALPRLGSRASIVHIGSLGAFRTFGKLDYEASKGALNAIVNTMAVEYGARGVRVNGVSPGQVWTPMGRRRLVTLGMSRAEIEAHRETRARGVPLQIEGSAWDVASAVLFLASDDAMWITGQNLLVDGGQSGVVGYLPTAGN
ncbi:SDR family NAD(P)-dependent oxidoreductase [Agrococcus baldri]|uniref:Dehydrogenase n=1 Tax=Agrococcus baldri TaxID=153730 RepID=A0AA87UR49_9MICO|nr:SDR family oxidoreductase [Agrococcus baldri]GEK79154.1 dehydrogenase [Agrococcus baldri]